MNKEKLEELLKFGREERFLEYKGNVNWDQIKEKIAKTSMAMSNLQDGGYIIIGVSQSGNIFTPEGLSEQNLTSYNFEDIRSFINKYSDPPINPEFEIVEAYDKTFLVIKITEFKTSPIICKKDGTGIRRGAIYFRPAKKIETSEISDESEMREILNIATERKFREFMESIKRVGINFDNTIQSNDKTKLAEEISEYL
ncbi:ATP-binding protein [Leptospira levettii]|uniref:AlbA family DNA-binding domain-containing protein n=1 Tax=Leptospira levettii TaxID=2023178 RepID=UPI0010841B70|nr:ATP-binding protein [Leptospira levettii]TGM73626.1 ATP-binding protein [Leptospira levettii]